MNIISNFIPL